MSRPWILVCPSSRGIGHALTRHLLQHTHPSIPILATARSQDLSHVKDEILRDLPSSASSDHRRIHLVQVDVTSESAVQHAAERASNLFPRDSHHLHLAFALPGVLVVEKSYSAIEYANALKTFEVNVLGPMMLMKWFADFLPRKRTAILREAEDSQEVMQAEEVDAVEVDKNLPPSSSAGSAGGYGGEGEQPVEGLQGGDDHGHLRQHEGAGGDANSQQILKLPCHATWVNMSARVGSISDNRLGGWYSYRSSKAAVNSLTKILDHELKTRCGNKAMAVSYHPGTVKTGLSREFWDSVENDRLFTPGHAADKMAQVVMGLRLGQRGRCWDWKGDEVSP